MSKNYLPIYNNLIKLTRNKNLYLNLKNEDTFSDRLIIFLLHFGFLLKNYKNELHKDQSQELFDFIIRQIELSIREIGYGDVSVNKKMKDYVNLFYTILGNIEKWEILEKNAKSKLIADLMNTKEDNHSFVDYFDKYQEFLLKNSFNIFSKDIINFKF